MADPVNHEQDTDRPPSAFRRATPVPPFPVYEPEPPGGVDRVTVAALAVTVVSVALGAWLGLCPPGAGTPQAQARGSGAAAQAKGPGGTAAPATPAVPHAPSADSPAGREAAPTGRKGASAGARTPMARRGARRHQRPHRSAHDHPHSRAHDDRDLGRGLDRRLAENLDRILGKDGHAGRGGAGVRRCRSPTPSCWRPGRSWPGRDCGRSCPA
ncbi:hypothetical protein ABZS51_15360, partial [Nonomuraea sp. NPDC005501]